MGKGGRKREDGREKERETSVCGYLSCTPPTGDLAHNPGMCPDWGLNWRPFVLQAGAQSTELHEPGQVLVDFKGHLSSVNIKTAFLK